MLKKRQAEDTTLQAMVFVALLFILLIPAFFGVYLVEEFVIMHLVTGIFVFLVLLVFRERYLYWRGTWLDFFLVALVLLYFLHLGNSYCFKLAFEEVLKYLNYFLVFGLVSQFVQKTEIKKVIKVLFFIGLLTTVFAFLAYFELIQLEGLVQGGRFYGTLKYCNALAAYLAAMVVFGYYLAQSGQRFYLWGLYFLTVGILGTQSRLLWLLFFPGILFWGWGFAPKKGEMFFRIIGITLLAFISAIFIFGKYPLGLKVFVFAAGSFLSITLNWLGDQLFREKKLAVWVGGLLSLGLIVGGLKYLGIDKAVGILGRFKSISLQSASARGRFVFYQDAFQIMRENHFLGRGGGAWQVQFPRLRSSYYYTPEVHSQFWETGVELGLLGLIFFVAVFCFVVFYMFKKREDPLLWSLGGAFLFIYGHGLVDLDLALGFMALVAWTILGLFNAQIKEGLKTRVIKVPKKIVGLFLVIYLLGVTSLAVSLAYSKKIEQSNNYEVVAYNLKQAIKFYPFAAQNYANLGAVYFQVYWQTGDEQYREWALAESRQARQKDPLNYNWYLLEAKILGLASDFEGVLTVLAEAGPYFFKFENDIYAQTAQLYRKVAAESEDENLVEQALEEILDLWARAEAEMASVPEGMSSWAERERLTKYEPFLIEVIYAYDRLGEDELARALCAGLSKQIIAENEWLEEIKG